MDIIIFLQTWIDSEKDIQIGDVLVVLRSFDYIVGEIQISQYGIIVVSVCCC